MEAVLANLFKGYQERANLTSDLVCEAAGYILDRRSCVICNKSLYSASVKKLKKNYNERW